MEESTLSKFTGHIKLEEAADTPDGCAAIQMDLDKLKKRSKPYEIWQREVMESPSSEMCKTQLDTSVGNLL